VIEDQAVWDLLSQNFRKLRDLRASGHTITLHGDIVHEIFVREEEREIHMDIGEGHIHFIDDRGRCRRLDDIEMKSKLDVMRALRAFRVAKPVPFLGWLELPPDGLHKM
jgi:hypothetical protein